MCRRSGPADISSGFPLDIPPFDDYFARIVHAIPMRVLSQVMILVNVKSRGPKLAGFHSFERLEKPK
jgi:hypothetical protein